MDEADITEAGANQPDLAGLRRAPSQKRSRERVERMLTAASDVIAEQGSDAMRMGEVAERAGVSIGSLYQYFPDKGSIIRTLADRYNTLGRDCIEAELADVSDADGFRAAFGGLIDTYYELFLAEPVMRDIWSGTQADKQLRDIDLVYGRVNGEILARALKRVRPDVDPVEIDRTAFLVMSLGEAAMRLAISVGREEGDGLVEAYKQMVLGKLLSM
ncbi:TetR/AcrR family transcriptional regulator [Mesorhizobium sp. ZC-5]|uniref:TetR/AcrR family transcriptional regulator n=1 Tax=Mesorhizobium sp. ZC-5 TaxID=2986066 RepID=UPI0021E79766|nr:TetR/AcrR family transcriptional regulator [Mesorhizobium sp. ZC-5]MCV3238818.1 TetR family transcriptional regulator [Mesorhizobium sp. ZC-5]